MIFEEKRYERLGERLLRATAPNGLRLAIVPKKGFSGFFACFGTYYGSVMRSFMLGGGRRDTPAGVAHYLEHKMFDMPDGGSALQSMTASGADPNAFTSYDETVYHFHCTENFYDNLRKLLHFVSTPYFTDETVAKERGIIAQEIRMYEDDPDSVVGDELMKLLYRVHPVRDDIAGTVESIAEITPEILYDCHRAFYTPGNMCLCVEGDVDEQRIAGIVGEVLGDEPRELPQPIVPEDHGAPEKLYTERAMSVSEPIFSFGAAFEEPAEDISRARIAAKLALRMLCSPSSPLYARLYREGLIDRSFYSSIDYAAGTATLVFGGQSRESDKVFEAVLAEAGRVAAEGFDPAYFERSRRASLGARLRGFEDFGSVCLGCFEAERRGVSIFDSPDILSSVTAEECRAFIARVLTRERTALSVVKPLVPAAAAGAD